MARPRTGTVDWRFNAKTGKSQWYGRWTRGDKTRTPWKALDPKITETDVEGAKRCAAQFAPTVRATTKDGKGESVATYASRWLADREGRISAIADDRARLRDHVLPTLGALPVLHFTRDDVEKLRDELDEKIVEGKLAWKTVASVWTLVTTMCSDMVSAKKRDLRARQDNPCNDVKAPERGAKKAKQYLYPSEFLTLVSSPAVPLRLRRAVAIAVYTFVRDGELRALRWDGGDIDIEHGTLSVTRALARSGDTKSTKSGETRRFAIEANLLPLLRAMHEGAGKAGPVVSFRDRHMSRDLRLWLMRAGLTRPELHKGTATRKPMTWHDLRATGLTWLAVRGDDPLKIKQRAGHSTFSTTEGYIREGEAVRDGFGTVFPPLPSTLWSSDSDTSQTFEDSRSSQKQASSGGGAGNRTRPQNELESLSNKLDPVIDAPTVSSPIVTVHDEPKRDERAAMTEPTDAELERGILDAIRAGALDVARVLGVQLEDRRRARVPANVVPLDVARRGRS